MEDRLQELEKMAAKLLEIAQRLPPGQSRQDALKEVGRLRARINAIRKPSDVGNE